MATGFSRLQIENWRQFRKVDIQFHPNLTVITGANGAGKTSILNVLGRHVGWNINFIATSKLKKKGVYEYYNGYLKDDDEFDMPLRSIGSLEYDDNILTSISIPTQVGTQFDIQLNSMQQVSGVFLPSHRAVYSYSQVDQIPTQLDAREQLFESYYANVRSLYHSYINESASARLKSSLMSLAIFGPGNEYSNKNQQAIETFEGYQAVLHDVLPPSLGFKRISIRMPEVVFECTSGDFSLDAASGGIAAILDLSWQIYLKSLLSDKFVVLCDEPENHLHPELQRSLLPGLIKAFPQVQFIVATHNPFIVTSVENSAVVILNYFDDKVESQMLLEEDRSGSSDQILRDVLGIPAPIPVWVEQRLDNIVRKYSTKVMNEKNLKNLRSEMSKIGIEHLFPEAISGILKGDKNDRIN